MRFAADWNKYGKKAGPVRNRKMADYAEALIAVWDGKSRETRLCPDGLRDGRLARGKGVGPNAANIREIAGPNRPEKASG